MVYTTRTRVIIGGSVALILIIIFCLFGAFDFCYEDSPSSKSMVWQVPGSVDMVVTWAGRPTPSREYAKSEYLSRHGTLGGGGDVVDTCTARYMDNGELAILIRRAFAYGAPWIRYIHIVMPDECAAPDDIIKAALGAVYGVLSTRVHVHRDSVILPVEAVPSFSSHPKEANLDRIPGLSEQFVYANDDMFLNRSTDLGLFFSPDGRPRYRPDGLQSACWHRDKNQSCKGHLHVYDWIEHNTASLFWTSSDAVRISTAYQCVQLEHQMKPLTRSGYRRARALFPTAFHHVTNSRFRSSDDFSPTVLIANLEMATGNAMLDTQTQQTHQLYLDVGIVPRAQRNFRILQGRLQQCHLLCLNNAGREWHASWISRNFDIDPLYFDHS
jgi:hypothetical protein